ncbi:MAG: hypothetical protein HY842_13370 [Bacteroidetes bacterium]|nr:hypothetical protein [Bacteroidota bacterium]
MKAILFTLFFFSANWLFGQTGFPESWQGQWTGTLEIFTPAGKVQELPMELHILPKDTLPRAWSYTIIYGADKVAGTRPYELVEVDSAKGQYLIDEKNSIKMEAYLLGGKFFQWFEVQGSLLFTSTELVGEELVWEIISGNMEPVSVTGNQLLDSEDIPPVKTFPVGVLQRARLRRL